jgi:hypothetical protein
MRLILAALLAASSAALAQDAPPPRDPLATRAGWEAGGQIAGYHYEEPNFITITGARVGVVGAYTFAWRNRMFLKIDGRSSFGSLEYQGSGTEDGVPDWILETRTVVGMDFFAGSRVSLSPYLGLGYRFLYDDLRGNSSTGNVGYRRYSNYLYAPVGLTVRIGLGNRWVLAPNAEADVFIVGKQKSQLSDTNLGYNDVTNTQKQGYGYRAYLMIEKDHFAFGPWMQYWNIKQSDMQPIGNGGTGYEPDNWTREVGIEFRYRF